MKGIHQFAANLLSYIPTKYYWNRSTSDLVIAKSKRVNFFLKHSVYEVVIPRDETSIAQMCEKLDAFFRDAFKDALLNKLFYRVN